jgi:hypothetical protein
MWSHRSSLMLRRGAWRHISKSHPKEGKMKLRTMLLGVAVLIVVFPSASQAWYMCPDGSYVSEGPCTVCPDGSYVGSGARCQITPSGNYVPSQGNTSPRKTPDGKYIQGGSNMRMCPDGTYVAGSRCIMTPDGKYVGGQYEGVTPTPSQPSTQYGVTPY